MEYLKTNFNDGDKLLLLSPIEVAKKNVDDKLSVLKQQGFARIFIEDQIVRLEELNIAPKNRFDLVVDRIIVRHEVNFYQRLADAIQIAFNEGNGACALWSINQKKKYCFRTSLN